MLGEKLYKCNWRLKNLVLRVLQSTKCVCDSRKASSGGDASEDGFLRPREIKIQANATVTAEEQYRESVESTQGTPKRQKTV